jgi:predicted metalloprotease with PDZ domain
MKYFVAAIILGIAVCTQGAKAQAFPTSRSPIQLSVDATDVVHGVYHIRETLPAHGGEMTVRFVKWLPGHHAPSGRVDLLAGLAFSAAGQTLWWARDPADLWAFRVKVPAGQTTIQARFDFMTPLQPSQGRVSMAPSMLELEWDMAVLYPAGVSAASIPVAANINLPVGWDFATSLAPRNPAMHEPVFATTSVATLVDSPVLAAPTIQRFDLGKIGEVPVRVDLAEDAAGPAVLPEARVKTLREMVRQTGLALASPPPFAHYDILMTISDEIGPVSWEHQQSSEVGQPASSFSQWNDQPEFRIILPHEFIHAWNGKYRRPAGLASADFGAPMNGSLLWIYEGLTHYYALVVSARSGVISNLEARDLLAKLAGRVGSTAGRQWRSLNDTTNEPAINPFHMSAPWSDYRRNVNDYYDEGVLLWLEVDAQLRALTHGRRSLDDFSNHFFLSEQPSAEPNFYALDDVTKGLNAVAPYDWKTFFHDRVDGIRSAPPVGGIDTAGWRLDWVSTPPPGGSRTLDGALDLTSTVGLSVNDKGEVGAVRWNSPAFDAGLTGGAVILAVDGLPFSEARLSSFMDPNSETPKSLALVIKSRGRVFTGGLKYAGGLRYPSLSRREGSEDILTAILQPK